MTSAPAKAGVLCVDDNAHVAEALRLRLAGHPEFTWRGWLTSADDLVETGARERPDLVLLDVDMPGRDPFEATAELIARLPSVRVVVFSGHVRVDLIERAMAAGAWGYVSKNDGEQELFRVLERVRDEQVAFSPEAQAMYDRL
jgi:two-component system response regulator DesR